MTLSIIDAKLAQEITDDVTVNFISNSDANYDVVEFIKSRSNLRKASGILLMCFKLKKIP